MASTRVHACIPACSRGAPCPRRERVAARKSRVAAARSAGAAWREVGEAEEYLRELGDRLREKHHPGSADPDRPAGFLDAQPGDDQLEPWSGTAPGKDERPPAGDA